MWPVPQPTVALKWHCTDTLCLHTRQMRSLLMADHRQVHQKHIVTVSVRTVRGVIYSSRVSGNSAICATIQAVSKAGAWVSEQGLRDDMSVHESVRELFRRLQMDGHTSHAA